MGLSASWRRRAVADARVVLYTAGAAVFLAGHHALSARQVVAAMRPRWRRPAADATGRRRFIVFMDS
jgi:hypothetical protein